MQDEQKTKVQLIQELRAVRARLTSPDSSASHGPPRAFSLALLEDAAEHEEGAVAFSDEGARAQREAAALAAERKRMLRQLHRQLEFTRSITDSLGEGIYALDLEGRLTFLNPAGERLLGWSEGELLGHEIHPLLHARHDDETREPEAPDEQPVALAHPLTHPPACPLLAVLQTGEPMRGDDVYFIRRDGTIFPVSYVSAPIRTEGCITGVVMAFHDISLRKRSERRLALQFAVSQALTHAESIEAGIPRVLRVLAEHLGWPVSLFWMTASETSSETVKEALHCRYAWYANQEEARAFVEASQRQSLRRGEGLPGRVWDAEEPIWIANVSDDANFPRVQSARRQGLHGAFGFPIFCGERLLGVIECFSTRIEQPDGELVQTVLTLGNQIGQFIERRRAEAAALASEARKSAVLETALDPIISISADSIITEFNLAAERMFGYRREDVLGRSMPELIIPPQLRSLHLAGLRRAVKAGKLQEPGWRIETTALRADGTEIPIEIAVAAISLDGTVSFTAHIHDLTARRQLEASEQRRVRLLEEQRLARERAERIADQLRKQAAEHETIIEAIPDVLLLVDTEGRIVRTNARGAAYFGLEKDGEPLSVLALQQQCEMTFPDGSPIPAEDYPLMQSLRGKTSTDFRLKMVRVDNGEEAHMLVSFAPIRDAEGHITGGISILTDITEMYRLERQKEEFLSIASHELKTPLTSLKILTQLTHRRLARAKIAEASQLAGMERSIERMERLVNDLLDVSRIEAGKLAMRIEPCDIMMLCHQAADEQEAASGRTISRTLPEKSLRVFADPERISQVLTNLLSNALKYSPPGTPVSIEAQREDHVAVVTVRDEGAGIPVEEQARLFERFYRVPNVQVQSGSGVGLGLGLYISREIVERHGGRIWVESVIGEGSSFRFALPLPEETQAGG